MDDVPLDIVARSPARFIRAEANEWAERVELVVQRRNALSEGVGVRVNDLTFPADILSRLFVYFPLRTTYEGFASESSDQLFDTDDSPPWDLWVWFICRLPVSDGDFEKPDPDHSEASLIAIAPDWLRDRVANGIASFHPGSLAWVTDYIQEHPASHLAEWCRAAPQ